VRKYRIIWYESLGFLCLIALSWVNQTVDLSLVLFGVPQHVFDVRQSILETTIALIVWLTVVLMTLRVLRRLERVESLVKVCPGCGRVAYIADDRVQWRPETERRADIEHTPDLCPDCAAKIKGNLREVWNNLAKMH
jgi:hypothetical protein